MKKGSEEYVAQNKELSQVKARMEELRQEIGLTSLTSAQLRAMSSQLNRELANLTPNTESFLNKAKELAAVDARLAEVRAGAKGVLEEFDNAGSDSGNFIKKAAGFAGIQLGVEAVIGSLKELGSESIKAAVEGSDSILRYG
jgi:chromosome segregation ATPase